MNVSRKVVASVAVVLFLSLAVNLFMAGVFAGRVMRPHHGPENVRIFSLDRIAKDLPPEVRKELRQSMQGQRRLLGDHRRALRGAQSDLARILGADPFDHEAALEAFANMRQQQTQMQKTVQDAMIAAAVHMPADLRRRLIGRQLRGNFSMAAPRRFEFRLENGQDTPGEPD